MTLHVDIETYCSVDIASAGAYRYAESPDFEILMVAYALGDEPVQCYPWEEVPPIFFSTLTSPHIIKVAHNAAFERVCFRRVGYDVPPEQWRCTAIKSLYCGLPMSLANVSDALNLGGKGKSSEGKSLIRYFSVPCKPTLRNEGRTRNLPCHDPEKWLRFMQYCAQDVVAEREIAHSLAHIKMPESEWSAYTCDQVINDRGVLLDRDMYLKAIEVDAHNTDALNRRLEQITGLNNPNSLTQLKGWIEERTGVKIESLAKEAAASLMKTTSDNVVREVLAIREQTGRTSVKKYNAMSECASSYDGRARGLFQFYGAGRTGRWAGRLIQLQNLPRGKSKDVDTMRSNLMGLDAQTFCMMYDAQNALSDLIRSAITAPEGSMLAVCDLSAIEARVIAWLAGEEWRLEVFRSHGKIYEASASAMFGIPMDQIGEDSDYRQRGKVAELALGFQGGVGAMENMGASRLGLPEEELKDIVSRWRNASPNIVKMWYGLERAAKAAIEKGTPQRTHGVTYRMNNGALTCTLPSGRQLVYQSATLHPGKYGDQIRYMGVDGNTKKYTWQTAYGGKLTENIVQAVARDIILHGLMQLSDEKIVAHVHDEIVCESAEPEKTLARMTQAMRTAPEWAQRLPLDAKGFITKYYKK